MKVIDLLNKIANGEIEDGRTFNINFGHGVYRSIYYDKNEDNCMCCLKNVSDDYSIYDSINFNTEVESKDYEEEKKIPEKFKINYEIDEEDTINMKKATMLECDLACRINEIIDYLKSKGDE